MRRSEEASCFDFLALEFAFDDGQAKDLQHTHEYDAMYVLTYGGNGHHNTGATRYSKVRVCLKMQRSCLRRDLKESWQYLRGQNRAKLAGQVVLTVR